MSRKYLCRATPQQPAPITEWIEFCVFAASMEQSIQVAKELAPPAWRVSTMNLGRF